MTAHQGIPRGAAVAIDDLLDQCARIKRGQEVLLPAALDHPEVVAVAGSYSGRSGLGPEPRVFWRERNAPDGKEIL